MGPLWSLWALLTASPVSPVSQWVPSSGLYPLTQASPGRPVSSLECSATVSDGSGTHWSHSAEMILVTNRNTLLLVTLVPRSQSALSQGDPRVRSPQSEA